MYYSYFQAMKHNPPPTTTTTQNKNKNKKKISTSLKKTLSPHLIDVRKLSHENRYRSASTSFARFVVAVDRLSARRGREEEAAAEATHSSDLAARESIRSRELSPKNTKCSFACRDATFETHEANCRVLCQCAWHGSQVVNDRGFCHDAMCGTHVNCRVLCHGASRECQVEIRRGLCRSALRGSQTTNCRVLCHDDHARYETHANYPVECHG